MEGKQLIGELERRWGEFEEVLARCKMFYDVGMKRDTRFPTDFISRI